MDKFLLVGLGNPGQKYQENRHNIGFKILNLLSKRYNTFFETDRYGDISIFTLKGRQILKKNLFRHAIGEYTKI